MLGKCKKGSKNCRPMLIPCRKSFSSSKCFCSTCAVKIWQENFASFFEKTGTSQMKQYFDKTSECKSEFFTLATSKIEEKGIWRKSETNFSEAVVQTSKKVFLKILQNSQENTCVRVSLAQVFSCGFCKISKNTFGWLLLNISFR